MTNQIKTEIQGLLKEYIAQFSSQAQAVSKLKGVSEATIIAAKNNDKWDTISEEMWRKIGKQVGWNIKGEWTIVETADYKRLKNFFSDAQSEQNVYGICAPEGSGKTAAATYYSKSSQNVFHIVCAEYFNRKQFLQKIMEAMGKDSSGMNVSELMDAIIDHVLKIKDPLIILDEADKISDQVLYFFITLYNFLEDKCGIILMATDFLQKRISKGVRINRKGFKEIYSRIGRKFISLNGTKKAEVKEICEANGITSPEDINLCFNDYEGDLRRLKKKIHNLKKAYESVNRSNVA